MSVSLIKVAYAQDDYLRQQSGLTHTDPNLLRVNVLLAYENAGLLLEDDARLVANDEFIDLLLTPDNVLMEMYSTYSNITSTRMEAILFLLTVLYSNSDAAKILGRDSDKLWITELKPLINARKYQVIESYVDGVILSNDLTRMEATVNGIVATDDTLPLLEIKSELRKALRDYYISSQPLTAVPNVLGTILETGNPVEIASLYDSSTVLRPYLNSPASLSTLHRRFPNYVFRDFKEFMTYVRSSVSLHDCTQRTRNERLCTLRVIATNLREGRINYLETQMKFLTIRSKEEYFMLCRAAGSSNNVKVVTLFIERVRYPYVTLMERNTEILCGALPRPLLDIIEVLTPIDFRPKGEATLTRVHTFVPGPNFDRDMMYYKVTNGIEVISGETFDIPKIIDCIVATGDSLEFYLTEMQIETSRQAIRTAVLRNGAYGYDINLTGTTQEYLDAVYGGNVTLAIASYTGKKEDDTKALEIAVRQNRIPVVRWLLANALIDSATVRRLSDEAKRSRNDELVDLFALYLAK